MKAIRRYRLRIADGMEHGRAVELRERELKAGGYVRPTQVQEEASTPAAGSVGDAPIPDFKFSREADGIYTVVDREIGVPLGRVVKIGSKRWRHSRSEADEYHPERSETHRTRQAAAEALWEAFR